MTRYAIRLAIGAALVLASCGGEDATTDEPGATATTDPSPTTSASTAPDSTPSAPTTTGAPPTSASVPSPTPTPTPTPSTSETTMTSSVPSDLPIVDQAIADLAARLDVDPSTIEVVSVDEVDWPDGSIGCPQPGMSYTQAIVNGTRIVLRVDGTDYSYHQGGSRAVFFCPADRVVLP